MTDAKMEIDHTEIDSKTGKKIAVVHYKGKDWQGDRTDRIAVPLEASDQEIKESLKKSFENRLQAQEIADRAQEIREASNDKLKGAEITPDANPKQQVDDLVEYRGMSEKQREKARKTLENSGEDNDRAAKLVDRFGGGQTR